MPVALKTKPKHKAKAEERGKSAKPKYAKVKTVEVGAFILLDRTGSMAGRWEEALSAINTYARAIGKEMPTAQITVAVFDSQNPFEIIRNKVRCDGWVNITNEDARPRGMTPLYQAIISLYELAKADPVEKKVFVITTDGAENASPKEITKAAVTTALDDCKARGWDIVWLGADFSAVTDQATSMGMHVNSTMNMGAGTMTRSMGVVAQNTVSYASGAREANVGFSDDDRRIAAGTQKPR